jgi:hypothetical protein
MLQVVVQRAHSLAQELRPAYGALGSRPAACAAARTRTRTSNVGYNAAPAEYVTAGDRSRGAERIHAQRTRDPAAAAAHGRTTTTAVASTVKMTPAGRPTISVCCKECSAPAGGGFCCPRWRRRSVLFPVYLGQEHPRSIIHEQADAETQ